MSCKLIVSTLAVAGLMLGGCAANVSRPGSGGGGGPALSASVGAQNTVYLTFDGPPKVTQAEDWGEFRDVWREATKTTGDSASVKYSVADAPPAGAGSAVLVRLYVNDYRYISTGARIGLGVMTGNAYMNIDAEFTELPGNRSLGKRTYNTSSSAWQGVFSAMTSKQVQAVTEQILADVRGGAKAGE